MTAGTVCVVGFIEGKINVGFKHYLINIAPQRARGEHDYVFARFQVDHYLHVAEVVVGHAVLHIVLSEIFEPGKFFALERNRRAVESDGGGALRVKVYFGNLFVAPFAYRGSEPESKFNVLNCRSRVEFPRYRRCSSRCNPS